MNPVDYVIVAVIALVLGLVVGFIYKSKKNGKKCIGCPDGGTCGQECGSCGCGHGCGRK